MRERDHEFVQIIPSERQVMLQSLEFYSFVHFTVNTFTGKEWGDGTESPDIFNPTAFDAAQWVAAVKSAGMKGLILTCKHHDGFCLWPSRYTQHSIAASPFQGGKGDIVGDVARECEKSGIAFGVYLSPWDRNSRYYGKGKEYDDYFVNQLTELVTGYGRLFAVWFDGACGEGPDGQVQKYDWPRYYEVIRKYQPQACINICGPDVRWCGNEAGDTRAAEWSVVPKHLLDTEDIAANSQQADENDFRQRIISVEDQDLGSRRALAHESELIWYPAEVDTSIRPGWFYHEEEDGQVRPLEELLRIYYNSVGGNATLLLNIPPTKEGLLHKNDIARLREMGDVLRNAFAVNLLEKGTLSTDGGKAGHDIECVRYDDYEKWFMTEDGVTECSIGIEWSTKQQIRHIVLKENIFLSQRVEAYQVEAFIGNRYQTLYEGKVIGYKRIIPLEGVNTDKLRIRILDARVAPTLSFIGIY